MIKYFCDKCGKELSDNIFIDVYEIEVKHPEIQTWGYDAETGTYILCCDCVQKLNKWINNKNDDAVKYTPTSSIETLVIPDACKSCINHPSNGGSGICHCTLGTPQVKC